IQDNAMTGNENAITRTDATRHVSTGSQQINSVCGAEEYVTAATKARMAEMEQKVQAYIARKYLMGMKGGGAATVSIVTVPVVFHVVWNLAPQDISDAQLQSQ